MGGQDGGIQGLLASFHLRPGVWLRVPISGWRWPGHQGVRSAWSVRWNTQQPGGLKRGVPTEHFPPEVSRCPTSVYEEGVAPAAQL